MIYDTEIHVFPDDFKKINRKIFLTFPERWFLWFFWILSRHLNRIPANPELFETSCTFLAIFFPTTNLSWRWRMSNINKCRSSRPGKHKLWISILSWFFGYNWKIGAILCWRRSADTNCWIKQVFSGHVHYENLLLEPYDGYHHSIKQFILTSINYQDRILLLATFILAIFWWHFGDISLSL